VERRRSLSRWDPALDDFDVRWPKLLAMAAFAFVVLSVSILRFRKSLE
jgi:hypothetical protein